MENFSEEYLVKLLKKFGATSGRNSGVAQEEFLEKLLKKRSEGMFLHKFSEQMPENLSGETFENLFGGTSG